MKKLEFNEHESECIKLHNCLCFAVAEECMKRNELNFDDIEEINNHFENHRWGTNADRKYRKSAINKAIEKVALNPLQYAID